MIRVKRPPVPLKVAKATLELHHGIKSRNSLSRTASWNYSGSVQFEVFILEVFFILEIVFKFKVIFKFELVLIFGFSSYLSLSSKNRDHLSIET